MAGKLTDEEHQARAALMGLLYCDGNGAPFYYELGSDGIPIVGTMRDAYTLEIMIDDTPVDIDPFMRPVKRRYRANPGPMLDFDW